MPPERIEKIIRWYGHYIAPAAFLAGFIFDIFTFTRSDLALDNILLIAHLAISGAAILLLNLYEASTIRGGRWDSVAWLFPLAMQFSFGAMFSGFSVLYWRSGSLASSWFFFLVLSSLLVGNEFFRDRYRRLTFHLSVYFTALFSYLIFALPIMTNTLSPLIFLASGGIALGLIALFVAALKRAVPERVRTHWRAAAGSLAAIYIAFNAMYFLNIIPPIPLALKTLVVGHSVSRVSDGTYAVLYEPAPQYQFFAISANKLHTSPGGSVYAFSSIFAPAEIDARVFHRWLYFDEGKRQWIKKDDVFFTITGGRERGYRGYSYITNTSPGKWRVEVRTERGQLLGRETFTIVEGEGGMLVSKNF